MTVLNRAPAATDRRPAPGRIGVRGEGPLADELRRAFAAAPDTGSATTAGTDAAGPIAGADVVVAAHAWASRSVLAEVDRRTRERGVPCLSVCHEPRVVVVGPWSRPDETGCHACALHRRRLARMVWPDEHRAVWERLESRTDGAVPLTAAAAAIVAALIGDEVDRLRTGRPLRTVNALLFVHPATGAVERHRFMPDPACEVCGGLPADSAELAIIALRSRPKAARDADRVGSLVAQRDALVEAFVDRETGVVGAVGSYSMAPTVATMARSGQPHCGTVEGYGNTLDPHAGVSVAVAEAIERLAGLRPGGKRTVVRASYRQAGTDQALDPRSLGLPRRDQVATSGGAYVDYHPDLVLNWVYGYSFAGQRPILVPESYAYYGLHGPDRPFAFECSNGCALGSCLEEAILHGVLEVAERDAFLVTWYARLPVPPLDPTTARDPVLRALTARLEDLTGCRLHAFDTTMTEGVPCVWVMLVNERDASEQPKIYCSAGSGLEPEAALFAGVKELAAGAVQRGRFHRDRRDRARALLADHDLVTDMEDHSLLYSLPDAWPYLSFLYADRPVRTVAEAFPEGDRYRPSFDLAEDLDNMIRRYVAGGLDVVVVDQTTPEQRAADLRCVKVIIPGTLSMTFGHRNRRPYGLDRLRQVPVRLGYRAEPLTEAEINPLPHPFP